MLVLKSLSDSLLCTDMVERVVARNWCIYVVNSKIATSVLMG